MVTSPNYYAYDNAAYHLPLKKRFLLI